MTSLLTILLLFQMQTNPWTTAIQPQYSMQAMANSCMAPHTNLPSFMGLAHQNQLSSHVQTQPLPQGASAAGLAPSAAPTMINAHRTTPPGHDTERRSSSIASLRLKAREHSVAMGILSAYGK